MLLLYRKSFSPLKYWSLESSYLLWLLTWLVKNRETLFSRKVLEGSYLCELILCGKKTRELMFDELSQIPR